VTRDELREAVVAELARIAPELDATTIRPDAPLRDEVDVDSMDFLNFIVALHERFGVEIPESDYSKLSSVGAIVAYVWTKLAGSKGTP
jgi:acyl carrier protein